MNNEYVINVLFLFIKIAFFLLFIYRWRRFELRGLLVIWNSALAIFSIIGASRTAPELIHVLRHYGLFHSVCDPRLVWRKWMCIVHSNKTLLNHFLLKSATNQNHAFRLLNWSKTSLVYLHRYAFDIVADVSEIRSMAWSENIHTLS